MSLVGARAGWFRSSSCAIEKEVNECLQRIFTQPNIHYLVISGYVRNRLRSDSPVDEDNDGLQGTVPSTWQNGDGGSAGIDILTDQPIGRNRVDVCDLVSCSWVFCDCQSSGSKIENKVAAEAHRHGSC